MPAFAAAGCRSVDRVGLMWSGADGARNGLRWLSSWPMFSCLFFCRRVDRLPAELVCLRLLFGRFSCERSFFSGAVNAAAAVRDLAGRLWPVFWCKTSFCLRIDHCRPQAALPARLSGAQTLLWQWLAVRDSLVAA